MDFRLNNWCMNSKSYNRRSWLDSGSNFCSIIPVESRNKPKPNSCWVVVVVRTSLCLCVLLLLLKFRCDFEQFVANMLRYEQWVCRRTCVSVLSCRVLWSMSQRCRCRSRCLFRSADLNSMFIAVNHWATLLLICTLYVAISSPSSITSNLLKTCLKVQPRLRPGFEQKKVGNLVATRSATCSKSVADLVSDISA